MDADKKLLQNLVQETKRGSLVMAALLKARTPGYGYSLVSDLQEAGIDVEQNTLYPLLRRLESQGLVSSRWDTAETRPRKYYLITKNGKTVLDGLIEEWKRLNTALERLIGEEE